MHTAKPTTFWDCLTQWEVEIPLEDRTQHPQVILAFTFGRGRPPKKGRSNEAIARHVQDYVRRLHIPCCVEGDIKECLPPTFEVGYSVRCAPDVHTKGYQGTYGAAKDMVQGYLEPNGFTRAFLIAQPDHAWRCYRVCRRLGLCIVGLETNGIPYDPDSTQAWCRAPWNAFKTLSTWPPYPPFRIYERGARLKYLRAGWM